MIKATLTALTLVATASTASAAEPYTDAQVKAYGFMEHGYLVCGVDITGSALEVHGEVAYAFKPEMSIQGAEHFNALSDAYPYNYCYILYGFADTFFRGMSEDLPSINPALS